MLRFVTRRLSAAVLILLVLSLVIFVSWLTLWPGDPARGTSGPTRPRKWSRRSGSGSA